MRSAIAMRHDRDSYLDLMQKMMLTMQAHVIMPKALPADHPKSVVALPLGHLPILFRHPRIPSSSGLRLSCH